MQRKVVAEMMTSISRKIKAISATSGIAKKSRTESLVASASFQILRNPLKRYKHAHYQILLGKAIGVQERAFLIGVRI